MPSDFVKSLILRSLITEIEVYLNGEISDEGKIDLIKRAIESAKKSEKGG